MYNIYIVYLYTPASYLTLALCAPVLGLSTSDEMLKISKKNGARGRESWKLTHKNMIINNHEITIEINHSKT